MAAGFAFLARRPKLWPLALVPTVLAALLLLVGLVAGFYVARYVETSLVPGDDRIPAWLGVLLAAALWLGTLAAGAMLGLAAALLLAAPALELLSRRVEALVRGDVSDRGSGLRWELAQSLRSGLYFLAAAPLVFLLGLFPLIGPMLAVAWGAHALSVQQTDGTLARRGLDHAARRAWHRAWRPESLGFGLGAILVLLVPCSGVILAPLLGPALTTGATLMVLELEGVAG